VDGIVDAPGVALSVKVDENPLLETIELALHDGVTPPGNPLMLNVTAPLKVPPVVQVIASVAVFPRESETVGEDAEIVKVGGVSITDMGRFLLAA
jgi:hypothetical protein